LTARWEYDHAPRAGSEEARLLDVLKTPRAWCAEDTADKADEADVSTSP
jgi:hypothetical protein